MESVIDKHLRCPRTLSRGINDDYQPSIPMFVARADKTLRQLVMVYLGVQFSEDQREEALSAIQQMVSTFGLIDEPGNYDITFHTDSQGYGNFIAVGYWRCPATYCRWFHQPEVSGWWFSDDRLQEGLGYFREIIAPHSEQFETLYSFKNNLPGAGAVMDSISGEVQDHGYWGSVRDRIPASQTDKMLPEGELHIISGSPSLGGRVTVRGHDNITLIRSGQDWMDADEKERKFYFNEMLPSLEAGMDFLRDEGQPLGCYSNRFVRNVDLKGNLLDISCNIGFWRSLDRLELWAKSHPTHLRIFNTFLRVASGLQKLRLYHEVSVSDASFQTFEYINCHPQTGMLRDAVF